MLLLVCVLRQVASFRQYTSEWRSTTPTLTCRRRFALRSIGAWRKSSDTFCISQPAYEFCRSRRTARTYPLPTGHLRGYFSGEGSSTSTKSLHKGAGRGAAMGRYRNKVLYAALDTPGLRILHLPPPNCSHVVWINNKASRSSRPVRWEGARTLRVMAKVLFFHSASGWKAT